MENNFEWKQWICIGILTVITTSVPSWAEERKTFFLNANDQPMRVVFPETTNDQPPRVVFPEMTNDQPPRVVFPETIKAAGKSSFKTISRRKAIVLANHLKVRRAPGVKQKVEHFLRKGERVDLTGGETQNWIKVQKGDVLGWVGKSYVKIEENKEVSSVTLPRAQQNRPLSQVRIITSQNSEKTRHRTQQRPALSTEENKGVSSATLPRAQQNRPLSQVRIITSQNSEKTRHRTQQRPALSTEENKGVSSVTLPRAQQNRPLSQVRIITSQNSEKTRHRTQQRPALSTEENKGVSSVTLPRAQQNRPLSQVRIITSQKFRENSAQNSTTTCLIDNCPRFPSELSL